ncbi:MAG: proline--tRNA ligase [Nitrospirae bacterium]|nr:proline--tRNA ligase [Nitrospirota bacterium]
MRYTKTLIPTLREVPSDAEAISHKLMLRAGYIRQLASGLYIYLPLSLRVMNNINTIIREEMNKIGAQEVLMPVLHPAEVWMQTGRWDEIGAEMFRLKDRTDRDMCLAMTHEEIMTWLAAREIKSYKDMPQIWFQIQTKLRDEARPKSGILRTREFTMKDSYSFDTDEQALQLSYDKHIQAYNRIFSRCGLKYYMVDSDPGMMGGAMAHEYMAKSDAGEDEIALCDKCGYAANVELAVSKCNQPEIIDMKYEIVETPNKRTVEEVSNFIGLSAQYFIKSLLVIGEKMPVLVLVRGDQMLHENKLERIIGKFRHAKKDEIQTILNVEAGFIGPVGHNIRILADNTLKNGTYISGANKKDYHQKGIIPDEHFKPEWQDIHIVREGELCPKCTSPTPLRVERVIEIGNIFKLGTKYSKALNAVFLNALGETKPIIMGSYGIGPARVAAAAVEQNNDADGIIWPVTIAPFAIEIIPVTMKDNESTQLAFEIYDYLKSQSIEVLIDDRDERPGVKFKDADLIGIPYQVVVGAKGVKEGIVELKNRAAKDAIKIKINDAGIEISKIIKEAFNKLNES